jgi:hypothetical protein
VEKRATPSRAALLTGRRRLGVQPPSLLPRQFSPGMQERIDAIGCTFFHERNQQYTQFTPHQRADAVQADPKRGRLLFAFVFTHLGGKLLDRG